MKRILLFTAAITIVFYLLSGFTGCMGDVATQADLNALEKRLKNEIQLNRDQIYITQEKVDSVRAQVILIQVNQDTMKNKLDRLQDGQIIIYSAIKGMEDKPAYSKQVFLQRLKDLLGL